MEHEESLFKSMQDGDWEAFNVFFERYGERLFHYALGFLRVKEVAEDVVQETFIYLWENRMRITCHGTLYAYLCRVVKNACIDYRLHEKVEERYRNEMQWQQQGADGEQGEEEERLRFEQLYGRLQATMDALPPKCREIFILGCVESMSYKEIAGQLDVSVNTVKTQMKVAYKKIKEELGTTEPAFFVWLSGSIFPSLSESV